MADIGATDNDHVTNDDITNAAKPPPATFNIIVGESTFHSFDPLVTSPRHSRRNMTQTPVFVS